VKFRSSPDDATLVVGLPSVQKCCHEKPMVSGFTLRFSVRDKDWVVGVPLGNDSLVKERPAPVASDPGQEATGD
jgi:hypothetical protein